MSFSPPAAAAARIDGFFARLLTDDPAAPFGMPGAVVAVMTADRRRFLFARGVDGAGRPVTDDSLLPLASASKLATGLVILRLVQDGAFGLDAPLAELLPEARAASDPRVTVRRLLTHTSGLPLEVPESLVSYDEHLRWPDLARACLQTALGEAPGVVVQYSNVAFGLLALAAERVSGRTFGDLLRDTVFTPLGIEAYAGIEGEPRAPLAVRGVPGPHVGTPLEPYNSRHWRALAMPWAGVTTTVSGLLALLGAYAGPDAFGTPALLAAHIAEEARRDQTAGELPGGFLSEDPVLGHGPWQRISWPSCPWGLAVEVQGAKRPHWGPPNAPHSFGHAGSSGCLVWYDPSKGVAWAILGTRSSDNGWLLRFGTALAHAADAFAPGAPAR